MKKLYPVFIFAALIFIVLWQLFFSNTNYYLVCVAVLIISMLPFFSSFERGEHTAKDITLIASLTALEIMPSLKNETLSAISPTKSKSCDTIIIVLPCALISIQLK